MTRRLGLHGNVVASPAPPLSRAHRLATGRTTGRPPAMENIGRELHKRASQLSINADDGTITDRRIVTSRERFTAGLGGRPPARILLEASTESEWVARHLESLGHEASSRIRTTRRGTPIARAVPGPTSALRARCWTRAQRGPGVRRIASPRHGVTCGPSSRCAMRSCAHGRGPSRWRRRWCDAMDSACRGVRVRGCRRGSLNSTCRRP